MSRFPYAEAARSILNERTRQRYVERARVLGNECPQAILREVMKRA